MGGSEVCFCTFPQARIKLHKYTSNPDPQSSPSPFLSVCALASSWAPCGSPLMPAGTLTEVRIINSTLMDLDLRKTILLQRELKTGKCFVR